jgi:hypothetical protein
MTDQAAGRQQAGGDRVDSARLAEPSIGHRCIEPVHRLRAWYLSGDFVRNAPPLRGPELA